MNVSKLTTIFFQINIYVSKFKVIFPSEKRDISKQVFLFPSYFLFEVKLSCYQMNLFSINVSKLCLEDMFQSYVSKFCFEVMFRSSVSKLCFEVLFRNSVSKICFEVLFRSSFSKFCFEVNFDRQAISTF